MKIKINLTLLADNDIPTTEAELLITLEKGFESIEEMGLTLSEAKNILTQIQKALIGKQVQEHINYNSFCKKCGTVYKLKGHNDIVFRTLFGKINIKSPRYKHCNCNIHSNKSFRLNMTVRAFSRKMGL